MSKDMVHRAVTETSEATGTGGILAFFYAEQWYCFDNFSAFTVEWRGQVYPTAEHAYQAGKYIDKDGHSLAHCGDGEPIADIIRKARSAHDAKKMGRAYKDFVRKDWDDAVKLQIMEEILRAKLAQHGYVRKKLDESRSFVLVENSPKDPFWGRGPDWKGTNHLGRLWMKIRDGC